MSAPGSPVSPRMPNLDGAALVVPALQTSPLPLEAVEAAPCTRACPAGINVKAYVSLIGEGRFGEALELVRRRCPLPGICGRVCHHPCEEACLRGAIDDPVAIRALKRFVADLALEIPDHPMPGPPHHSERVAVIGSGPAGLTAAYDLRHAGYPVTVFEAAPEPGGMLRYGIADYRLPPEALDAEIAALCRAGIEIRTGCRIGVDLELEELLGEGWSAVLFAIGAQSGRRLGVPGEEGCDGIEDALSFLRRVNEGDRTPVEGRVLVIGGGSTAIEAARSALRLGAESVEIVYRRTRAEMPASEAEIAEAEAEGVRLSLLVSPKAVRAEGRALAALECVRNALGERDASGRRRPVEIPGSEFEIAADRVLAAIGQTLELDFLPDEVAARLTEHGRLTVDPETAMTPLQGVFAAGDAVTGPATVIEAVAAGHRAAASIRGFLESGDAHAGDAGPPPPTEYCLVDPRPASACRLTPPTAPLTSGREFAEVELPYRAADAVAEAGRCMRCGPCGECALCAPSCNRRHLLLRLEEGGNGSRPGVWLRAPAGVALGLPSHRPTAGRLLASGTPASGEERGLAVDLLPIRVRVEESRCRGCGRCIEVCPFDAILPLNAADPESAVTIEATRCRGCNLCAAVCPTAAVETAALSAEWWASEPGGRLASPEAIGAEVVLACQRRSGQIDGAFAQQASGAQIVHVRCVGQLDAGFLLELRRRGARRILVAGCLEDSCRYGRGATLASRQVAIARSMLGRLGQVAEGIVADWMGEATGAPLDPVLLEWMAEDRPNAATAAKVKGA